MKKLLTYAGKIILGCIVYVIANNVVINAVSLLLFNYYYIYIFGVACNPGFTTSGIVITSIFIAFKISIIAAFSFVKKLDILAYYLIFDAVMTLVLGVDFIFGTYLFGWFYSNRPLLNLSNYIFGNNTLVLTESIIAMLTLIYRYSGWFKPNQPAPAR